MRKEKEYLGLGLGSQKRRKESHIEKRIIQKKIKTCPCFMCFVDSCECCSSAFTIFFRLILTFCLGGETLNCLDQ